MIAIYNATYYSTKDFQALANVIETVMEETISLTGGTHVPRLLTIMVNYGYQYSTAVRWEDERAVDGDQRAHLKFILPARKWTTCGSLEALAAGQHAVNSDTVLHLVNSLANRLSVNFGRWYTPDSLKDVLSALGYKDNELSSYLRDQILARWDGRITMNDKAEVSDLRSARVEAKRRKIKVEEKLLSRWTRRAISCRIALEWYEDKVNKTSEKVNKMRAEVETCE